jgi:hypothetical protein
MFYLSMSSEIKFENHSQHEAVESSLKTKVNLTDLLSRLHKEEKREKKSNLALTVAAVSAVTVFGIILSL